MVQGLGLCFAAVSLGSILVGELTSSNPHCTAKKVLKLEMLREYISEILSSYVGKIRGEDALAAVVITLLYTYIKSCILYK